MIQDTFSLSKLLSIERATGYAERVYGSTRTHVQGLLPWGTRLVIKALMDTREGGTSLSLTANPSASRPRAD